MSAVPRRDWQHADRSKQSSWKTRFRCLCGERKRDGEVACSQCMSVECECGEQKNVGSMMCEHCAFLDGEALPTYARAVLSELRQLVHSSGETLNLELSGYSRRIIARAIACLLKAGRIRRREVEAWRDASTVKGHIRDYSARRRVPGKPRWVCMPSFKRDVTSVIAEFELVEDAQ